MKSKLSRFTLIFLFLALLYVPTLVWLAAGDKLATPNLENRELYQWPKFDLKNISKLPTAYENYYRDHIPFRNQVISAYAQGLKAVFNDSVVTTVLFGKNDWFMYNNAKDGDPIAAYRGEKLFSTDQLRQISVDLRKTRDALKRQGIDFVLFIAPNKERIYPEYMPDRYGEPAESYAVKQLVDFLHAHTDLNVVYVYDELMQAKADFPDLPLYYSTDTHWNGIGAYVGARSLLKELGVTVPALSPENVVMTSGGHAGDLSILAHLNTAIDGDAVYTVTDQNRPDFKGEQRIQDLQYFATGQKNGKKLFVKNDSFNDNMAAYVFPWFSETRSYFNEVYDMSQVDEFKPDVFVQVCVERYVEKWLTRGPLYLAPGDR